MIGALFRLVFRGIVLVVLAACAFGVYHLYRSGQLPLVEKAISETALVGSVKAALAIHRDLSQRELAVSVEGSTVQLRGVVATDEEKLAAAEIAGAVEGVDEVVNDLDVDPERAASRPETAEAKTIGERLDDVALLAKIRAALHLDREVRKLDIDVSVSSGAVALSGTVPTEELHDHVIDRVSSVGGVITVSADALKIASPWPAR